MASLDQGVVDALKKAHGPDLLTHKLGAEGERVVFVTRPLSEHEFQMIIDMSHDDKKKSSASKRAAELALVYPAADERAKIFARRPGWLIKIGDKVVEDAGIGGEVETEKL